VACDLHEMTRRTRSKAPQSASVAKPQYADIKQQLSALGLAVKDVTGDGNCLFRALSDQYDGDPRGHAAHRESVCAHIERNKAVYAPWIDDSQSFEQYVSRMRQDGVYGGNLELVAFAREHGVDIAVHQHNLAVWIIRGREKENEFVRVSETRGVMLHIVYHSWEHYSSVRNADGPWSGPPEIRIRAQSPAEAEVKPDGPTSVEKAVMRSCGEDDLSKVRELLAKFGEDPNKVINYIWEKRNEPEGSMDEKDERGETGDNSDSGGDLGGDSDGNSGDNSEQKVPQTHEKKPPRLSAREKRDLKKRARKERRMAQKRIQAVSNAGVSNAEKPVEIQAFKSVNI